MSRSIHGINWKISANALRNAITELVAMYNIRVFAIYAWRTVRVFILHSLGKHSIIQFGLGKHSIIQFGKAFNY